MYEKQTNTDVHIWHMGNSYEKLAPEIVKVKWMIKYYVIMVGKHSKPILNAIIHNVRKHSTKFRTLSSEEKV